MRKRLRLLGAVALSLALVATSVVTAIPASAASNSDASTDYSYSFYFYEHTILMNVGESHELGYFLDPYAFEEQIHFKIGNTSLLKFSKVSDESVTLTATGSMDQDDADDDNGGDGQGSVKTTPAPSTTVTAAPDATPTNDPNDWGSDDDLDFDSDFTSSFNRKGGSAEDDDPDNAGSITVGGSCKQVSIKAIYQGKVIDSVLVKIYDENGSDYTEDNDSEYDTDTGNEDPIATKSPSSSGNGDTNYSDSFELEKTSCKHTYTPSAGTVEAFMVNYKTSGKTQEALNNGGSIVPQLDANAAKCVEVASCSDSVLTLNCIAAGSGKISFNLELVDGKTVTLGSTLKVTIKTKKPSSSSSSGGSSSKPSTSTTVKKATKPAKIAGFKVTATGKKVTVKWTKHTKNTKGFYIYRKVGGKYKKIGTAKASTTSFKETLKSKGSYSYKMRAYNGSGKKISYSSYTSVKTVKIK